MNIIEFIKNTVQRTLSKYNERLSKLYEDTGFKLGDGYKYRIKSGLLFVFFGDYSIPTDISEGTSHIMGTLPQEYRPSTRVLGVILAGTNYASVSVEVDGRVTIAFKTNVSAGVTATLRGQLITIM